MKRVVVVMLLGFAFSMPSRAQNPPLSPAATVLKFYKALKEKRYIEGFRYSIYRAAIEGLSAAELSELEPDFARTFAEIPDQIETKGEQINRNSAVVFVKFAGQEQVQRIELIRDGNDWLVGDEESLALVKQQGRAFFFNTRMQVNESETAKMLARIFTAEAIYAEKFEGRYLDLAELVKRQAVPEDMSDGEANGYKFVITVSDDKKNFILNATPVSYGKSGKLSFYLDPEGLRAEDKKGQPASRTAPIYHPNSN
ncbi:MAG: hypothetical protein HY231_02070 [Acidobacteria bacterium]|nr:hypothetical protein [Acidobacteriota bacterium]